MKPLYILLLALCGCVATKPKTPLAIDPHYMATPVKIESTNSKSMASLVVIPPPNHSIDIPLHCEFTNGCAYIVVSTNLINWWSYDDAVYDMSLTPEGISTLTFSGELPQVLVARFVKIDE